jgi:hypothetical protein
MSDEPINRDSPARKWLKAVAWAYLVIVFIGQFTGVLRQLVAPQYRMPLSYVGFALIMVAYRRPGLWGWLLVLLGWAIVAAAIYDELIH